jgi:hypothetical protein
MPQESSMVELSNRTRAHIRALFRASDVELAERTLIADCGNNLPQLALANPEALERIRFAVLRLSGGRVNDLAEAVELARADWRDLLVAAEFADDTRAHLQWVPRWFGADVVNRWLVGESLPDVTYTLNQPVCLRTTSEPQTGSVINLVGLEPEPKYLVELGSGKDVEVFQRHLAAAE